MALVVIVEPAARVAALAKAAAVATASSSNGLLCSATALGMVVGMGRGSRRGK